MYYSPEDEHAFNRFSQVLEIPVTDFELSVRSRNCLKKMNIKTLGDLTRVSEQHLLSSKNFGETSLTEIKEMMTSKGLRLGQSLEEGAQYDMEYRPQQPMSEQEQAVLEQADQRLEPVGPCPQVHEPPGNQYPGRFGATQCRRATGVEELRHDVPERSARKTVSVRLISPRRLTHGRP